MFASTRKPATIHDFTANVPAEVSAVRDAVAGVFGDDVDYTRGTHPTDAIIDRVLREYMAKQATRDRYPSQEFVSCLNTGRGLNPELWRERRDSDARLVAQTDSLVAALERTGINATGANDVVAVGLITREFERLNGYRSICFLPLVAQRDRRPMLNELRYFRSQHRSHGKYMRYAVITNGPTVPAQGMPPADVVAIRQKIQESDCDKVREELRQGLKEHAFFEGRQRTQDLARTISRVADWAREKYGIDFVYRGIEYTVKQRGSDDHVSMHPHANVLYTPPPNLSKRKWRSFLSEMHDQLGGWHWQDNGVLENPKEAIKYAFKPVELEGISDATVRWLYEQTFGLKMAQPMGAFMRWRHDELTVQEWFNEISQTWGTKQIKGAKMRRRKHRKVVTFDYAKGPYSDGPSLGVCSVRKRPGSGSSKQTTIVAEGAPPPENVLMGITMPQRRFSPFSEPCALIMNYTPTPATEWGQEALDGLARESAAMRPVWHMNGAPDPEVALALGRGQAAAREGEAAKVAAFSVHTRSSTAERRKSVGLAQGPPSAVDPVAVDEWLQTGVDFSTG